MRHSPPAGRPNEGSIGMARLSRNLTRGIGVAIGALVATTLPAGLADASPADTSTCTVLRPRTEPDGTKVPLGVYSRRDGRLYARVSGTTTGGVEPTVADAAPRAVVPRASTVPAPTGTFDGTIFREPLDLSTY